MEHSRNPAPLHAHAQIIPANGSDSDKANGRNPEQIQAEIIPSIWTYSPSGTRGRDNMGHWADDGCNF